MNQVVEIQNIEQYLEEVQRLVISDQREAITNLIAEQSESHQEKEEYIALFQGEKALHNGQYEQALVSYMQAKGVPFYEFFCFRATAYLSHERGDPNKALSFIEKALTLRPDDHLMVELKKSIEKKTLTTEEPTPLDPISSRDTTLERRIDHAIKERTEQLEKYLSSYYERPEIKTSQLTTLKGWEQPASLFEKHHPQTGGFFISWGGKGIAINPGPNFLDRFHKAGHHIKEINAVVVTRNSKEAWSDIKRIYELNTALNKISGEMQVIHYYLDHKAYQTLSPQLKPSFKQEKNTVHSLELFLDSPDVEKETLAEGIIMRYFSAGINSLGIRFDLSTSQGETHKVGYLSHATSSPLLAHNLGKCDILIAGYGRSGLQPEDTPGELHGLGYQGVSSLLTQGKPKVLLVTEFDGSEGDVRLEITKKLRLDCQSGNNETVSTVLPADNGLSIDLKTFQVTCSTTTLPREPYEVQVTKTNGHYSKLNYLSEDCVI